MIIFLLVLKKCKKQLTKDKSYDIVGKVAKQKRKNKQAIISKEISKKA